MAIEGGTQKYREKYAKQKRPIPVSDIYRANGYAPFRIVTPAGHADIYRLCDALDRLKRLAEEYGPRLEYPWAEDFENRVNQVWREL